MHRPEGGHDIDPGEGNCQEEASCVNEDKDRQHLQLGSCDN